jgi:hypothetical protein
LTPGLRFEASGLPGGFLPVNFIAIGIGPARYVSSGTQLDGGTAIRQRATTVAIRVDLGLTVRLRNRLGFRVGAVGVGGEAPEWFERLGLAPPGEHLGNERLGGYVVLYLRH